MRRKLKSSEPFDDETIAVLEKEIGEVKELKRIVGHQTRTSK